MAVNIPNTVDIGTAFGQGLNSGGDLFTKIMNPKLKREELKQNWQKHLDDIALRREAAARAGALNPLRKQLLEQQILALKDKNDPESTLRKFNMIQQMMGGDGEGQSTQNQQYPEMPQMFAGQGAFPDGVINQGNIDLNNRPQVPNPETGGTSSVYSMSMGTPYGEVLIPRVTDDGRILSEPDAIENFKKTGKHLGIYGSPDSATEAAQKIHEQQAQSLGNKRNNGLSKADFDEIKRQWLYHALGAKAPTQKNNSYQGEAKNSIDLQRLKKEYGENSPEYQTAKEEHDAKISAKKDLSDLRARTKAGLKPGEKEFFDPESGEPLGKEIPYTAKERESEEGNALFNELYPIVYKGAAPFSGEGSIERLEKAARNYKTSPEARKAIDDLLLSDKMMAATTVNEASTLKAGRTNQTYKTLKESLEAQDIPKVIKRLVKEFQIPASAQLKASMRYQKALSDARNKAKKSTPATQKFYYNPESQSQHEKEQGSGTVAMIKDGEEYDIPKNMVSKAESKGYERVR